MNLFLVLRMAAGALVANRMRTALTMLGIMIGIAAVICAVAIGEGGSAQVRQQLLNLGDNMVWVEAGGRNVNGVRTGTRGTDTLTLGDAEAIRESVSTIKSVSPNVDDRIQVINGNRNWYTVYRGVGPEYLSIRRYSVESGISFSQEDVERLADVCLIGRTVQERLFGDDDPLGKTIRVKALPFKVIGVLAPKGLSPYGQDQDDLIIIPYTTAQHKLKGVVWLDDIFCSATGTNVLRTAQDMITRLLRQRHHIRWDMPDDFNIRSPDEILRAEEETSRTFTFMLASIACVSLVVGGIGIMNIMLVSVVERTREIGVRMAVGATRRLVQLQFLSEAVVLSMMGGAMGLLFGFLGVKAFAALLEWPMSVSVAAVAAAVAFSATTGVFFGYYPAQKAARLQPIEALRYE